MSELSANLDDSESVSWVLSFDIFTMMIELYCLGRTRQYFDSSMS
jgi:hypothetical protein